MRPVSRRLLHTWSPRIAAALVALALATFSLDALSEGPRAVLLHLAPALFVMLAIGIAWQHEWIGAVVFAGLALAYAVMARRHIDWIVVIAIPLLIVGVLYHLAWLHTKRVRAAVAMPG